MLLKEYVWLCRYAWTTWQPMDLQSHFRCWTIHWVDHFELYPTQRPDVFCILMQLCTCTVTSKTGCCDRKAPSHKEPTQWGFLNGLLSTHNHKGLNRLFSGHCCCSWACTCTPPSSWQVGCHLASSGDGLVEMPWITCQLARWHQEISSAVWLLLVGSQLWLLQLVLLLCQLISPNRCLVASYGSSTVGIWPVCSC